MYHPLESLPTKVHSCIIHSSQKWKHPNIHELVSNIPRGSSQDGVNADLHCNTEKPCQHKAK